jgi:hypothetical protein
MHKREVLENGQIEIQTDYGSDCVEVRFIVTRAPLPPTRRVSRIPTRPRDPIFDWASMYMVEHLVDTVSAQLKTLPHYLGEQVDVDPDTGECEVVYNDERLLELLENATSDERDDMLRAPDVQNGIRRIRLSRHQAKQKRLRKLLETHTRPRSGAPLKRVNERKDVQIAERVQEIELQLIAAFEWLRDYRRTNKYLPELDTIREQLTSDGLNPTWAKHVYASRTPFMAACRVVAAESDPRPRTPAAMQSALARVKQAARRGRKYL